MIYYPQSGAHIRVCVCYKRIVGNLYCETSHPRACLKTEELTDFSQESSGCKEKRAGIFCIDVFRVFLTQQMLFPIEKGDGFDFFEQPLIVTRRAAWQVAVFTATCEGMWSLIPANPTGAARKGVTG